MAPGYQALRETAAYLDLSARGKIFATGEDRVRFLHAMSTNNIQQLQPGQGCYAFFLNPQGRILSDANIFVQQDRILLDVEPEARERIYQHLDKFLIADDCTLEDAGDKLAAVSVEGPTSEEILFEMGVKIPEPPFSHVEWNGCIVARANMTGATGFRIFAPRERLAVLIGQLTTAAVLPALPESARIVRLEHSKPRYGEDITEANLPQETQQTHALNFSKGCYIGQEIVERVRSRGHVNRLLMGVRIGTTEAPAAGTKLTADGADAGEITSAAFSPALNKVVALGYLRAQVAVPGVTVKYGESEGITTPPAAAPEVDPVPTAGY